MDELGNNIRHLREKRGYTLKQIAEKSGLSVGFISQVERAQTEPSLASLKKLASALEVTIKELFEQVSVPCEVVRKGKGVKMTVDGVKFELLAAIENKAMEPLFECIEPGGGTKQFLEPHEGEEFVWIKSGSLTFRVGECTYRLNEGDSIYFKADQPHTCVNDKDTPCEVLWISTPPMYT